MEKVLTAIIGIALITTLVLPGRNTAGVITASGKATSGLLAQAMGTAKN